MRQMLVSIHFTDEETGIQKWAVTCSCMVLWLLVGLESEFELRRLTSEHLLLTQTSDKPQLLTCLLSLFSRNATTSHLSVPSLSLLGMARFIFVKLALSPKVWINLDVNLLMECLQKVI